MRQGPLIRMRRIAAALVAVLAAGCALTGSSSAELLTGYHTQLLSQPSPSKVKSSPQLAIGGSLTTGVSLPVGLPLPSGTPVPTGPSGGATISHDRRFARFVAFQSRADNLVDGDANRHTDVFVVPREGPFGPNGSRWRPGTTFLASHGMNGEPANGDSWGPQIDGGSRYSPSCVVFLSDASNLVPGDTNGATDAFVFSLRTGEIRRVSVGSGGQEANGRTTQVAVNNNCDRVAFTSEATNLTGRVLQATPQVYVRFLAGRGAGRTKVASASRRGRPGNGPSFDPDMPNWGRNVVFASRAPSLGAREGHAQVLVKQLPTRRSGRRLSLRMVSRTRRGRPGNGDSTSPSASYDGRVVAYQTTARNIAGGYGQSQIVQTSWTSRRTRRVTRRANGASQDPAMTDAGSWVFFSSHASNLAQNDGRRPAAESIYLWLKSTGWRWIKSDPAVNAAASAPETSMHGNYLVYERAGLVWMEYLGDR